MQHVIKCCIQHIYSKLYSIYAMACLYTILGYTQYLPTGKYTNSSSWTNRHRDVTIIDEDEV